MKALGRWCSITALMVALPSLAIAQTNGGERVPNVMVTPEMLQNPAPGDWLMYGGNYANQRYSTLNQISSQNVARLVPRMVIQTNIERLGSFENTPIVADGMMYITTPYNVVFAYDLRKGKEVWRYEHKLGTTIFCCGPNNRGVAIGHGMVYMATLDARVVALDAKTGEVKWEVEDNDPAGGYSLTLAPLLAEDKVIVGTSGAEYGIRGNVTAYDARTGQRAWRWHTIPSPAEGGWWGKWATTDATGRSLNRNIAKEKADSARHADAWQRGGGSMWMTPAYDPDTKTLYMGIGNPSPDLDGTIRPGDNLWTESIVAIDAANGRMKWGLQYLPHDVWDLDAASPPIIARDGNRKVVVHAGKTGWVYVIDAETGRLIRHSEAFVPQENMYAQPTPEGTRMLPGANGGAEWSPIAYSPQTDNVYVLGLHQPMHYKTHYAPWEKGRLWLGSAFVAIPGEEQWGTFTAINIRTGKITWQAKTEQPMMGGALATAGGLVFTGEGNGLFKAYDARTGRVLWQFQCGAGANAAPMSFSLDGEQMIAIAAGGNFQLNYPLGSTVFVFGLPKSGM